jgi:hypothetical protein
MGIIHFLILQGVPLLHPTVAVALTASAKNGRNFVGREWWNEAKEWRQIGIGRMRLRMAIWRMHEMLRMLGTSGAAGEKGQLVDIILLFELLHFEGHGII